MRANIVWDESTLDAYLADPQSYVVGMRMPFGGIPDNPADGHCTRQPYPQQWTSLEIHDD